MVRLRKISLAESKGSSRFFKNKVVSDFDFGHFLRKLYLVLPSLNYWPKGETHDLDETMFPIDILL